MTVLLSLTALMVIFAVYLHIRQNSGEKLGGDITAAKSFWLFYCMYTWLFFIPYALFTTVLEEPFKTTWTVFTVWFWIRSFAEALMLFKTKNWTPPIGVIHDLSCLVILIGMPFYFEIDSSIIFSPPGIFHLSLILSLILETYYAYSFFKLVGGKTKGEKGIWYANKHDPIFKRIVLITCLFNYPVYFSLGYFIYSLYF
jgi:hypothetical protein